MGTASIGTNLDRPSDRKSTPLKHPPPSLSMLSSKTRWYSPHVVETSRLATGLIQVRSTIPGVSNGVSGRLRLSLINRFNLLLKASSPSSVSREADRRYVQLSGEGVPGTLIRSSAGVNVPPMTSCCVATSCLSIDALIQNASLHWSLERIGLVERNILHVAILS